MCTWLDVNIDMAGWWLAKQVLMETYVRNVHTKYGEVSLISDDQHPHSSSILWSGEDTYIAGIHSRELTKHSCHNSAFWALVELSLVSVNTQHSQDLHILQPLNLRPHQKTENYSYLWNEDIMNWNQPLSLWSVSGLATVGSYWYSGLVLKLV